MTNTVLATEHLTKQYQVGENVITAVSDISINIEKGEFVALVGPSGSGKTTMLAMLAGLLAPTSGGLTLNGRLLSNLSEKQLTQIRREKIGFTFQSNNLVPYLNVLENVELMLQLNGRLNKESRQKAKRLLTRLGLEDRLKNLPAQLSGGQKQRVAIARSLIHDPDLVLADEPTASLDTERAYQVVQTFAELIHEEGKAGIMVTHDLRMCRHVDRVIEMVDGELSRIITDPRAIEAFAGATDPHTADLSAEPFLNGNGHREKALNGRALAAD